MPRPCAVCTHPQRDEIDRAILQGESDELIARRFGKLSRQSVQRHGSSHLPETLRTAYAHEQAKKGRRLLERATRHVDRLERMADESNGKGRAEFLAVSRDLISALTLLGKVTGEIQTGPQLQVTLQAAVFQRLDVKNEDELRRLVESGRKLEAMEADASASLEDLEDDAVQVLSMIFAKNPGRRSAILARLSSGAEEVDEHSQNGVIRPVRKRKRATGLGTSA